jgi:thioredoxin reductase
MILWRNTMTPIGQLPIAIIGAGPVGLAAAAELIERGLKVRVYEAGPDIATNVQDWGHVRLFSPWRYNTADAAARLLTGQGWSPPDPDILPTGDDLYQQYLKPLSESPQLAQAIETGIRVEAITRLGLDKVVSKGRETAPFVLSLTASGGSRRRDQARAVIDASGTWTTQNPLGASGLPVDGEAELSGIIAYGTSDVLGRERDTYAARTTLVVGGGHSAANVILDLHRLNQMDRPARVIWAIRSARLRRIFGGGADDELPARGELGTRVRALVEHGHVELVAGFSAMAVRAAHDGKAIVEGEAAGGRLEIGPIDRIVVATGQRPDHALTRELRLELDPWLESTRALGPLIDPNVHSCGSVPPHSHRELAHPEPDFYTIGIKSYGRAPTFLLLTGYEQARSVVAAIAGDLQSADTVRLVLPETGVCSIPDPGVSAAGCCGGPAPEAADACCVADAAAKADGKAGCGCRVAA